MDSQVQRALLEMSAHFYDVHADSFDDTRQGGWDAWIPMLEVAQKATRVRSVLDLGCGNGRFLAFLQNMSLDVEYLGIDSAEGLLSHARPRYPRARFENMTVETALRLPRRFDLVACFGVFHHLPGSDYRTALLRAFSDVMNDGAVALISLWRPALLPNFENKTCPVEMHGLDEGDYFLGWNGDCSTPRYCHHFDTSEIKDLVTTSGLELLNEQRGSGNDATNHYLVLQKRE